MRLQLIALAVSAAVASPAAFAQQSTTSAPMRSGSPTQAMPSQNLSDSEFAKQAAIGGMFEVESSRIALQKAQNQQIKQFAQQMIQDHQQANHKLASLMKDNMATGSVSSGGTSMNSNANGHSNMASAAKGTAQMPQNLDAKHQQMLQQLQNASGAQFDQLYAQMQLQAHQEAVALFQNYAQNGSDPVLKTFAQQTLPKLQQHLQEVQSLSKA
jgi:putative membrane protein